MKNTFFLTAATLVFSAAQAQTVDSRNNTTNGTITAPTGTTTGTTASVGTNNNMGVTGNTYADSTRRLNTYGSYSTRDSIAAKYKLLPMPGALTIEKTFPILGTYQLSTTDAASTAGTGASGTTSGTGTITGSTANTMATESDGAGATPSVTITIDSASKGIVWVEGLQQGRFKAYLRKSPATYRIVAQKSGNGVSIPEGTMMLDQASNTLHIAMGAAYNEADPAAVFGTGTATASETVSIGTKAKKGTKAKPKVTYITATKVDPATQQTATQQTQGNSSFQQGLEAAQQGDQSTQQSTNSTQQGTQQPQQNPQQ